MTQEIIKFVEWTKVKIRIHLSEKLLYFREGEIWWASLGVNIGHEQDGKNQDFERPILVLKKFNRHTLWAIPLSTKTKDGNQFYYQYEYGGVKFSAILSQLRLISSKRLSRKVGMFPSEDWRLVKEKIRLFL